MGAVVEHDLSLISADQALLKETKKSGQGEPVEVLEDGSPSAEFGGQGPPGGAV